MKKTVLASSLALALGVTGYAASSDHNQAHASEQNIDKAHLAELALNNSSELNEHPVHAGAYNYNFNYAGHSFSFQSNGSSWSWTVDGHSAPQQQTKASNTNNTTKVAQPQQAATSYTNNNTAKVAQPQQSTSQQAEVKTVSAPKASTSQAQTQSTTQSAQSTQSTSSSSSSSASTGGSVKAQFLAAGGTEALWNTIVIPESGGNPNAVNELGYRGLGQTKESWGTGSVADQTKGLINYAKQRYGSVDSAVSFRSSNNWW